MQFIKEGSSVLYLWSKSLNEEIEKQVNKIKAIKNVTVKVENVERLLMGKNLVQNILSVTNH